MLSQKSSSFVTLALSAAQLDLLVDLVRSPIESGLEEQMPGLKGLERTLSEAAKS